MPSLPLMDVSRPNVNVTARSYSATNVKNVRFWGGRSGARTALAVLNGLTHSDFPNLTVRPRLQQLGPRVSSSSIRLRRIFSACGCTEISKLRNRTRTWAVRYQKTLVWWDKTQNKESYMKTKKKKNKRRFQWKLNSNSLPWSVQCLSCWSCQQWKMKEATTKVATSLSLFEVLKLSPMVDEGSYN